MICKKCSKKLTGKQTSYCSTRCSKLHLKSLYKKRNKEKLLEYSRNYRKKGLRPLKRERRMKIIERSGSKCIRCGCKEKLNVHHVKPLRCGGDHSILMVLCFLCHMEWEQRMKGYWIENTL